MACVLILDTDVAAQGRLLEPQDVIELNEIAEVQLSPAGERVVYAIRGRDVEVRRATQSFWLWTDREGTDSLPIDERALQLRWRPDGGSITYLAPDSSGITQIWEYAPQDHNRKITTHSGSILSHEWSPDGRRVAFITSRRLMSGEVYGKAGVIIDKERFFYSRLLAKESLQQHNSHYGDPPTRNELWVYSLETGRATLASDSLSVGAYAWSPDGRALALSVHRQPARLPRHLARRDLVLYHLDDGRIDILEAGSGGDYYFDTVIYDHPFWSPDGTRIGYFRTDLRDRWDASAQLGIFSLAQGRTVLLLPDEEFETYEPRGFWLHPDTVLIETTYRAGRRLFAVAVPEGSVSPVVRSGDWFDQHSFSRDGRLVAFVRERIDRPPELYISHRAMRAMRRLTDLHVALAGVSVPHVERVRWMGRDSVEVEGWLYLPSGRPPFPTIVFVHGGPRWVFPNRYEPYVRLWPHAFGAYTARGLAVFVPNYRGTGSYGKAFRRRSALDAEPIGDIIAGVDMLVRRQIVDASRLGIAGHSHGCWLGALIAVRHRRFAAGACAEGTANWASTYQRNAGWLNSEVVEYYWGGGASPYMAPERYHELSPVFGFGGLRTPFLFEAGELASAAAGIEFATAAWRAGVPHELVIYRETGHNVADPRVMLEVMERNLEWFEFWLLGRSEGTNESKRAQYQRWRGLKEDVGWGTG